MAYVIFSIALIVLLFSGDAHAYLDPATGSYIFQILIAGLLGGLFAVKMFWRKIKAFYLRVFSKKSDAKPE